MKDCLFCKIIKKEMSAEIIYEDEQAMAILDINPRAPGHTMVLPKIHCQTILDLPEKKIGPIFEAAVKVTYLLQKSLEPNGFTIGINQGKISGQIIDHLHIHIIPRFENDGGGSVHSVVNNPPTKSLAEIKKVITGVIANYWNINISSAFIRVFISVYPLLKIWKLEEERRNQ